MQGVRKAIVHSLSISGFQYLHLWLLRHTMATRFALKIRPSWFQLAHRFRSSFAWLSTVACRNTGKGGVLFRNALCDDDRADGQLQCVTYALMRSTSFIRPSRLPLTTLREFSMLRLVNMVTDNPEWHVKVCASQAFTRALLITT
jgi:hypothetical protein